MTEFVMRRFAGLILTVLVAVVLTFAANQFVPGDPVTVMLGDQSSNKDLAAKLRAEYGLDRPVFAQFASYAFGLLRGEMGLSFRFPGTPVTAVIADGLAISPLLAGAALLIAAPLGITVGVFAALRRGTMADTGVMLVLVAGLSIPNFALAALFVWLFSIKLGWLPVAGWGRPLQAVMPIALLAIPAAAYLARLARTFMLEVLQQDYMRTARAKGLAERLVIWRHGLRNVLLPILTVLGVILGGLITGTFVVETLFNIPGLGRIAIQSIFARDYPVTMGIVMLFTLLYATINFAVDVLYGVIDPRVRVGAAR
ncbi:MAG: ABC transporter permease [Alphaproteobacteria bacterium]|nr:ABC transporter permease [Alphaproteobacteria bacterium]